MPSSRALQQRYEPAVGRSIAVGTHLTALCLMLSAVTCAVAPSPNTLQYTDSFCDASRPFLYTVRVQFPLSPFSTSVTNSVTSSTTCTCWSTNTGECKLFPKDGGVAESSENPKCSTTTTTPWVSGSSQTTATKVQCAAAGIKCYDVQAIAQVRRNAVDLSSQ